MGAFDSYRARAACPRCAAIHWVSGQTKIFLPDFGGLSARDFQPGVRQQLDFSPGELSAARVWDDEWVRMRPPEDAGHLDLLADLDDLFSCGCGQILAVILRFRLFDEATPAAELTEIALLDAAGDIAGAIDLACGEDLVPWGGSMASFTAALEGLAKAPFAERARTLHDAIARRFAPDPAGAPGDPWTVIAAPMRCTSCGEARSRRLWTALSHPDYLQSFFGAGWTAGELRPEAPISIAPGDLCADEDRGYYIRLRHPGRPGELTVLGDPETWGCRCGAGRASVRLRFSLERDRITLLAADLLVIRRKEDLLDIDYAYAPASSRAPRKGPRFGSPPASKEAARAGLIRAWTA